MVADARHTALSSLLVEKPRPRAPLHQRLVLICKGSVTHPSLSLIMSPAAAVTAIRIGPLFVPHGGGPMPLTGDPSHAGLTSWLKKAANLLPQKPTSILCISGHWEEKQPTLTAAASPPLLFDYYGFPEETYKYEYKAPGSSQLVQRVSELLSASGLDCKLDKQRGFDHGVFVPLSLLYPHADVPVVVLSLLSSLDPAAHIRLGEALAPLAEEGVLVLGSGMTYHNMQGFSIRGRGGGSAADDSKAFDDFLTKALTDQSLTPQQRRDMLVNWKKAPKALECHPREEHLLPLFVAAGAAGLRPAEPVFQEQLLGVHVSGFHFH